MSMEIKRSRKTLYLLISLLMMMPLYSQEVPVSKINKFAASSFLPSSKVSDYEPENICDFDQSTAWVEGVKGDGVGEWVAEYLGHTDNLNGTSKIFVSIYYGYQKSLESLSNNGAPTSYKVSLFVDSKKIDEKIFNTYIYEGEEESECWGGIGNALCRFDLPLGFPMQGNIWIKVELLKVRPGIKYKDTAVSEVIVNFVGANPFNAKEKILNILKNKNYEGFYVLNEKQVAIESVSYDCGLEVSLFEYNGLEWKNKSKKYFNGYWPGGLNEKK